MVDRRRQQPIFDGVLSTASRQDRRRLPAGCGAPVRQSTGGPSCPTSVGTLRSLLGSRTQRTVAGTRFSPRSKAWPSQVRAEASWGSVVQRIHARGSMATLTSTMPHCWVGDRVAPGPVLGNPSFDTLHRQGLNRSGCGGARRHNLCGNPWGELRGVLGEVVTVLDSADLPFQGTPVQRGDVDLCVWIPSGFPRFRDLARTQEACGFQVDPSPLDRYSFTLGTARMI